jgi:iron complex transport system ATP-binding protein
MAIIEVKDLSAGYENGYVLENISFSLKNGEFLSILGRNGSGKSTLIKALQGLLKNVSGQITVDGFSFEFSVMETILMGRYIHQGRLGSISSSDSRMVEEVMSLTQIDHLKDKKIAHLSGGERQRVFIARALAQDTPFLFLDEPSSHLDISYYSLFSETHVPKRG